MSVASQKIYSWAFETNISGPITPATISEAATQYRQNGGARVWLLDAGAATAFDLSTLAAVSQMAIELRPLGLDRVAVVLPVLARPFVSMINIKPISLHSFGSRAEAVDWLRRGCP